MKHFDTLNKCANFFLSNEKVYFINCNIFLFEVRFQCDMCVSNFSKLFVKSLDRFFAVLFCFQRAYLFLVYQAYSSISCLGLCFA
jgi:hypothetical protein